jgi:uncharacterized protein (TIGR03000 family)
MLALAVFSGPLKGVPPGGHYSGVYQGGYPGSANAGDRGTYIGGYSGGYHEGYSDVYQGGSVGGTYGLPGGPFYGSYELDRLRVPPPPPGPDVAVLNVHVPARAQLSFEGLKIVQPQGWHSYLSPPLTKGDRYTYHIQAMWDESGRPVEISRKVAVQAGDRLMLDLAASQQQSTNGSR